MVAAVIIAQETAGDVWMTDTRADEVDHGITIKSWYISYTSIISGSMSIISASLCIVVQLIFYVSTYA